MRLTGENQDMTRGECPETRVYSHCEDRVGVHWEDDTRQTQDLYLCEFRADPGDVHSVATTPMAT